MSNYAGKCTMYWWEEWISKLEIVRDFRWNVNECDDRGCQGCPYFGGLYADK